MNDAHAPHSGCCGCSAREMGRRTFLAALGTGAGVAVASAGIAATRPRPTEAFLKRTLALPDKRRLVVQPVLAYGLSRRRPQTSWRPWGGLHTEGDIAGELTRIGDELQALSRQAEFPLQFRPLARASSRAEAAALRDGDADVLVVFAATAGTDVMEALISPKRYNLVFVRHRSGPVYLWYEVVHPRLLRKTVDEYGQPGLEWQDVVVDDYGDLLWRLRALYALKNAVGSRIVCIGGAGGWGAGGAHAPQLAAQQWKMELPTVSYDDLGKRIVAARSDARRVQEAENDAARYLSQRGTALETDAGFVSRAFLLTSVFEDLMVEAQARAITVNHCMGTIMPLAETTACLPLSLINDSGAMAFCESDFAVIPSGVLLHYIAGTPVFLQDPTFPHHGIVTLAHCTAPRRMDGKRLEHARILTHFESDYGAAPKVEMRIGQEVTVLDPDFSGKQWHGFLGTIQANPFLDICRSQVDVAIRGEWQKLVGGMQGFHWMLAYGDHLKETGYALHKLGIGWCNITGGEIIEA